MPWTVMHPAAPGGRAPGQDAGWLGKAFDPFHVDGDPNAAGFQVQGLGLPEGISAAAPGRSPRAARTAGRHCRACRNRAAIVGRHQQKAARCLASAEARGAFQIDREDPKLRDRYGRHIHGQCLLLARRLVEAGVGLVTVNWHNDGRTSGMHKQGFTQVVVPPYLRYLTV